MGNMGKVNMHRTRPSLLFYHVLALICVSLAACGNKLNNTDPFYTGTGGWDSGRFPLIKPYEVVRFSTSNGWFIKLHVPVAEKEIYTYLDIQSIQDLAVQNGVIMVYTPWVNQTSIDLNEDVLHWFVIVPDRNIETGFETEEEFLAYIHTLGIGNPSWIEPDVTFQQFVKTRCLDWIPDCR